MTDEYPDAVDAIWFVLSEHGLTEKYDGPEAEFFVDSEKAIREKIKMVIDEERKRAITAWAAVNTIARESSSVGLFQQSRPFPHTRTHGLRP